MSRSMWELSIEKVNMDDHPLMLFAGAEDGSRSRRSRLNRFIQWQLETKDKWYMPELVNWRDALMADGKVNNKTVQAYLDTVRAAYRRIIKNNEFRDLLYEQLDNEMSHSDKQALVSEYYIRLANQLDPDNAPVSVITVQDEHDPEHHHTDGDADPENGHVKAENLITGAGYTGRHVHGPVGHDHSR